MEQSQPAISELLISGPGHTRRVPLDKPSLIIGRSLPSGLILEDQLVSRQHARIYQDPFGRWVIEDLGSRNGLWIGGQRITMRALTSGERVEIGPFVLSLCPVHEQPAAVEAAGFRPSIIDDSSQAEIFTTRIDAEENIPAPRLRELNFIIDSLAEIANSSDLYGEACRQTARMPEEVAMVLRLSRGGPGGDEPPQILAWHRSGQSHHEGPPQAGDFRLSRRVIEAVRQSPQPVQASNVRSSKGSLMLTITDDEKPRTVMCVPIAVESAWADVLYLDVPADRGGRGDLDFVRAVGRQIGFARKSILLSEQTARSRILDHQLDMAREIQSSLMPRTISFSPSLDMAVFCEPAMWVGGNHCDVWQLADGRIALVVGDVSGKGLPAALVMTNLQAALRTALDFCPSPAKALTHVSRHLEQHMPVGTFVTLFLGLLDPSSGRLEYVNAGHIQPLLLTSGGASTLGKPQNTPLGISNNEYVADVAMINPGDAMVVVTDGVTEAMSPQKDEFGCKRLEDVVGGLKAAASAEMVAGIAKAIAEFRSPLPQHDDVTILALRRLS